MAAAPAARRLPWRLPLALASSLLSFASLPRPTAAAGPAAVVLLGPSGSGKSETGNTLLDSGLFKVSGGLESETLIPSAHVTDFGGRQWQVVDTPGYFDTSRTPEELAAALERFSEIVSDHIVALAFVVPYGRFGDAHLRGWRLLRGAFGAAALPHTALIFTACGERKEEDVKAEVARLCTKTPPPMLCGVIDELGAVHGGSGMDRVVTFGALESERRARDRAKLFELAAHLERNAGGRGYDHGEFVRAQSRRKLMAQRIAAIGSEEDRRVLELLYSNVEAGAASDADLLRRLEEAEGVGESRTIRLDFEDRTLGPFVQVGSGWRQPMPVPYIVMREYATTSGAGGNLFVHTGTDSGVKLRHGDERTGEIRTAPFLLGRGPVTGEACGGGGFIAVCPADDGEDPASCKQYRLKRASVVLDRFTFSEEDLSDWVGSAVYLRVVDDQRKGWGFVALDNLEYPVLTVVPADNGTEASGTTSTPEPPQLIVPGSSVDVA